MQSIFFNNEEVSKSHQIITKNNEMVTVIDFDIIEL